MNSPTQAAFERSHLAYGLRKEHVDTLSGMAQPVFFHGNEEFIRHGDRSSDLYVILDGTVLSLTDDGDKLCDAGAGCVIGEISFIDACPRSSNAVAINAVTALKFPAQDLRKRMCEDKEFGFAVLANLSRVVCARLRKADSELDRLMDTAHELWNTTDF